ncbi:neuropeptide receptor [Plakobranchus ocellatus]|uniref:Neuropeptide receptor n=1 Tax=Plakobranchus ocellatus TaxID=259542 RepID=A0AAV4ALK6_9GAST|nr:neuropeptide receptor [Plakobranchus ocellatus]
MNSTLFFPTASLESIHNTSVSKNVTAAAADDTSSNLESALDNGKAAFKAMRSRWFYIIFPVACFLLAMIILVFNSVFVTACWRTRSLRTLSSLHVISLAASDMLQAVGMMLQMAVYTGKEDILENRYTCLSMLGTFLTSMSVSFLNVAFIAVDRYIYIIFPFRIAIGVLRKAPRKVAVSILDLFSFSRDVRLIKLNTEFSSSSTDRIKLALIVPRNCRVLNEDVASKLLPIVDAEISNARSPRHCNDGTAEETPIHGITKRSGGAIDETEGSHCEDEAAEIFSIEGTVPVNNMAKQGDGMMSEEVGRKRYSQRPSKNVILSHPDIRNMVLWSESCVPQNRNRLMSIALSDFLNKHPEVETTTQKFAEMATPVFCKWMQLTAALVQ